MADCQAHNLVVAGSNPAPANKIKLRKEEKVEELENSLVAKIGEQLNTEKPNIQYLDVLNRLLCTVTSNVNIRKQ